MVFEEEKFIKVSCDIIFNFINYKLPVFLPILTTDIHITKHKAKTEPMIASAGAKKV